MGRGPRLDDENDRRYREVVRKINRIVVELEELGEHDMDVLRYRHSMRFHSVTNRLRSLSVELTNDIGK